MDRLRAVGSVPLLVGGSGLYVRAVLDELEVFFASDMTDVLAAALEDEVAPLVGGADREGRSTLNA